MKPYQLGIVCLCFLFVGGGIMYLSQNYELMTAEEISNISIGAYNSGVNMLYNDIIQTTANCEAYPIPYQNQTVNLVLVECLNLNQSGGTN